MLAAVGIATKGLSKQTMEQRQLLGALDHDGLHVGTLVRCVREWVVGEDLSGTFQAHVQDP